MCVCLRCLPRSALFEVFATLNRVAVLSRFEQSGVRVAVRGGFVLGAENEMFREYIGSAHENIEANNEITKTEVKK
jgi:hypothetical protein